MGYFPVRYDSRVVIYERKMFKRLATEWIRLHLHPAAPGSSPKHTIYTFSFYLYSNLCYIFHLEKKKIKNRPDLIQIKRITQRKTMYKSR